MHVDDTRVGCVFYPRHASFPGAAPYEFINPAWVLKWSASGSWYKPNWAGNHNFQFGFEWGDNYNSYVYNVNQGINAIFNSPGPQSFTTPFQVVAYNTPTTQKNYFRDTSFYLQDAWTSKRRLTLNLGLRYDRFTTYYRTKKNLFGSENAAVSKSDYVPITALNGSPIMNPLTNQPMTLYSFQPSDPSKYGAFSNLVTNFSQLDNNSYNAVEFTAVKRLSHKWQILGGFTVQRQKGVFGRGFSDEATSDNFTDPNNHINRNNNFLNLDATYVFKVDSTYELPWKFGTSVTSPGAGSYLKPALAINPFVTRFGLRFTC